MKARQPRCQQRHRNVARGGSLVVALLVCFGVLLLPLRATGSDVPSALDTANVPRLDLQTNGNAPPLEGIYLLMAGEEVEDADKDPLNAELLRMLLLTLCFGLSVGWLLRNAHRQGALCSFGVVSASFASACEDLPFLGVFRL